MDPKQQFAQLVQAFFCEYLVNQRDVSQKTVTAYRDTFRLLLVFLQDSTGRTIDHLTFADLDADTILAFCRYLEKRRGNCVRSVNCRLAALRCFLHYAGAQLGPDVTGQIQRVMMIPFRRFTRPLLGYLTQAQIKAILQVPAVSWTGRRDRLLLQFLYNTGARVSEACSVTVEDVCVHDLRAVQLRGKGRKQRVVPFWRETTRLIRAWIKTAKLTPQTATVSQSIRPSHDPGRGRTEASRVRGFGGHQVP